MSGQFLIYALADPRDGERFYVGQSSRGLERPREHWRPFGLQEHGPKTARIRSIMDAGCEPQIEVLQYVNDPDAVVPPLLKFYDVERDTLALDDAEQRWIAYGRAVGWPLTNRTDGGDSLRWLERTSEHNAKISASRIGNQWSKGIPKSEEHRAKLSAALKGRQRLPEHAAKIAAANQGRKHRPETIEKMRLAHLGRGIGRKASLDLRAKLSVAHKGIQAGIRNPNFGKVMPDELKNRISRTKRHQSIGRWLAFALAGIE